MPQSTKFNSTTKKLGMAMLIISWFIGIVLIWILSHKLFFSTKPQKITKLGDQTTIKLHKNYDGHYNIIALINNYKIKFLIDTGASQVSISENLANKLKLPLLNKIYVSTASGEAVAYKTVIDSFVIGQIKFSNIHATIMPNLPEDFALLGMNILRHFDIIQKEDTLTLIFSEKN